MRRDRNRNGGGIVVYVAENIGFNQLENDAIVRRAFFKRLALEASTPLLNIYIRAT